jgi:vacuolar protein sorting-associated protein 13A/C
MSFEPVSADMQIVMPSSDGSRDAYVGLSYAEGLGKVSATPRLTQRAHTFQYKLSKVITIAPRFLIKNTFSYPIKVRQHSTDHVIDIKPAERKAYIELHNRAPPQLSIAFDEPNLKWCVAHNMFSLIAQVCSFQHGGHRQDASEGPARDESRFKDVPGPR